MKKVKSLVTIVHNYFFCLRYPFMKAYNVWTREFCGYSFTEYDAISFGWRKAFGKQMLKDIKRAYKLDKKEYPTLTWKTALQWSQIKSKYGTLRLYASATKRIMDVLHKYESLSRHYCEQCGNPSKYETSGWIEYLCEDCFGQEMIRNKLTFKSLDEYTKYLDEHKIVEEKC